MTDCPIKEVKDTRKRDGIFTDAQLERISDVLKDSGIMATYMQWHTFMDRLAYGDDGYE